jgi:hypothetical protein
MDHIAVLREEIARLRSEIADIQALNDRYRFGVQHGAEAEIAHVQRQERLQEIQEELIQLSNRSHKALSIVGNHKRTTCQRKSNLRYGDEMGKVYGTRFMHR